MNRPIPCYPCSGTGKVTVDYVDINDNMGGGSYEVQETCEKCGGKGFNPVPERTQ